MLVFVVVASRGESPVLYFLLVSKKVQDARRLCCLMMFSILLLPWEVYGLPCGPISCSIGSISKGLLCLFWDETKS
jgi:hypothetical protein